MSRHLLGRIGSVLAPAASLQLITVIVACCLPGETVAAERPVRSLLETRRENLIIQQWDNSCAAAALATVLTYDRGFPVTEEQVARGMLRQTEPLRVRQRGGFSLLDMKRHAAQLGFDSDGYSDMTLDDVAARVPVIVPITRRGYSHFVVVRKVTAHDVHVGDPSYGNYRIARSSFMSIWPGIGFEVKPPKGER